MQESYSELEDALIIDMKYEGASYQQIAEVIGRSRDSVRSRWRKLNRAPVESKIANKPMKKSSLSRLIGKIKRFFGVR